LSTTFSLVSDSTLSDRIASQFVTFQCYL